MEKKEKISKKNAKQKSLEQIKEFFQKAEEAKTEEIADRYVKKARRLAMSVNQPISRELKRKFCKHCYKYFKMRNYRVRTRNGKVIYYCFHCKNYTRYVVKRKQ